MVDITIVNGVYKPTYNWGAPSCMAYGLKTPHFSVDKATPRPAAGWRNGPARIWPSAAPRRPIDRTNGRLLARPPAIGSRVG